MRSSHSSERYLARLVCGVFFSKCCWCVGRDNYHDSDNRSYFHTLIVVCQMVFVAFLFLYVAAGAHTRKEGRVVGDIHTGLIARKTWCADTVSRTLLATLIDLCITVEYLGGSDGVDCV